ncbi:hypothetical protein D3250_06380 [Nesterenkonia natronophila]|uniref:PH domain-containing protein n=2 Tax=Nesterenkonia natronophila TaxID=2174932 RepID=A0A3A4F0Q1_9MICC|nr:hypothetical protein D3250_06380 [Nesterenkonia natronophila]
MLLKLVDGEQAIIRTRAHHRALIPAAVNLLVTIGLLSFLLGYVTRDTQPAFLQHYSYIAVFLLWTAGLLALGLGTVKPLVKWLNRLTYLTTERIVQKNFLGAPQARVIPLALLSQHEMRQSTLQEMAGAGDLVLIHGAYGQHQRTRVRDMPDVERFNTVLAQELGDYRRRAQARVAAAQHGQPTEGVLGDVRDSSFGGGHG